MNYTRNSDLNYYKENPWQTNCGSYALRLNEWYDLDEPFEEVARHLVFGFVVNILDRLFDARVCVDVYDLGCRSRDRRRFVLENVPHHVDYDPTAHKARDRDKQNREYENNDDRLFLDRHLHPRLFLIILSFDGVVVSVLFCHELSLHRRAPEATPEIILHIKDRFTDRSGIF